MLIRDDELYSGGDGAGASEGDVNAGDGWW